MDNWNNTVDIEKSVVRSLHFTISLRFTPGLQSAVFVLHTGPVHIEVEGAISNVCRTVCSKSESWQAFVRNFLTK